MSIPVEKIDPVTGEVLDYYRSIARAARDNYIHQYTIGLVVRGRLKTAAGYKWRKNQAE